MAMLAQLESRRLGRGPNLHRSHAVWLQRLANVAVLEAHDGCVNTIRWAAAAQLLLSGSDDRRVGVWDYSASWEGKLVSMLPTKHRHNIFDAQQVPGMENSVITTAADGRVGLTHLENAGEPSL